MEAAVLVVCAIAALAVAAALLRLARGGDHGPALVALPVGVALAAAALASGRWPPTAWLLLLSVLAGPVALAYRVGTARAWNALIVFAVAGAITGYGLLERFLCRAAGGPCDDVPVAATAAIAGGTIALGAYAWLLSRARSGEHP